MKRLGDIHFSELLPGSIKNDPSIKSAAESLNLLLNKTILSTPNLLIWARLNRDKAQIIEPLARLAKNLKQHDMDVLELLAWQLHIDFRDVAKDKSTLEKFILESIPWHRVKGTPGAVEKALDLYGVKAKCDESGVGNNWAVYELELEKPVDSKTLSDIARIAEMSAPKRCSLRRVHGTYDDRPLVWDNKAFWDYALWDDDSGVWNQEAGIKESFNQVNKFSSKQALSQLAYKGIIDYRAAHILFSTKQKWDDWCWDNPIETNLGFLIKQFISFFGTGLDKCESYWFGRWGKRAWSDKYVNRERKINKYREVSKSQVSWDDTLWDSQKQRMDRFSMVLTDKPTFWDQNNWDRSEKEMGLRKIVVDEYEINKENFTLKSTTNEFDIKQNQTFAFKVGWTREKPISKTINI